jgi:hypothetical protein
MNDFFPKRLCWFSEVPDHSDPLEARQKTEQKNTTEAQQLDESQQTPETSQETLETEQVVKKVLERDEKNLRAVLKLEGVDPTEGAIKMKLVEEPTTTSYIEETNHQELQEQFRALQENTRRGVQDALRAA